MKLDSINYYFIDIDGTITDYKPNAMNKDSLLAGNFLFPIIRDMMVEDGWSYEEAGLAVAREPDNNVYWDYVDFIKKFNVCEQEAFDRMRQWHYDNLIYYEDMVETVKELALRGKQLYIISNNPFWGCLLKLEFAGLANETSAPYFKHIFGTNIINGCKNSTDVWKRALAYAAIDPGKIATIGDNPSEDGTIPQSCGIGYSFILKRTSNESLHHDDKSIFLNDARQILTESI